MAEGTAPVILVHGGAGVLPASRREAALDGCRAAAEAGWRVLRQGGDAVEAAVTALEDDPEFNAGTGGVLNADGELQLDASLMRGHDLAAGAVAAVRGIRNPIRLARRVMEHGRHVLLVGPGAERFADLQGVARCDPAGLVVARERERWRERHGTVGCVALDGAGRMAAGTSTGGRFDALPGRVGDSPLIGCGTYADGRGAASCTGIGEDIIRVVLAKAAVDELAGGRPPAEVAGGVIALLHRRTGSEAGIILMDDQGRIGHAHNAQAMAIAWMDSDGRCQALA